MISVHKTTGGAVAVVIPIESPTVPKAEANSNKESCKE